MGESVWSWKGKVVCVIRYWVFKFWCETFMVEKWALKNENFKNSITVIKLG